MKHKNIKIFIVEIQIRKQRCISGSFLLRKLDNIIPIRLILSRRMGIMSWKERGTFYIYDGKTGCREMGDFR